MPKAARVMEEAEPDALAYLDFPRSHWAKLRTNNCQERTNREIKRRTRVVQVFPSVASLERLVGAVLWEQDRCWDSRRYLSGERMSEFYDGPKAEACDPDELEGLRTAARRTIEASLRLAEGLEAA